MKTNELHASNYWVFIFVHNFFCLFQFKFRFNFFWLKNLQQKKNARAKEQLKCFWCYSPHLFFLPYKYIYKYTFYIFGAPSHLFDMLLCTHTLVILYPLDEQHVFRTQVFFYIFRCHFYFCFTLRLVHFHFSWTFLRVHHRNKTYSTIILFFCWLVGLFVSFCNISYSKSMENRTQKENRYCYAKKQPHFFGVVFFTITIFFTV